ncbi:MAG: ThuA domain-containing protein [Firmicutes bacterium]|nr:ThuA domain-containing protein [Bacillota bacterium]
MVRVTVWNEYRHEKQDAAVQAVYPQGIHRTIQEALSPHYAVDTATLDEPEHGLTTAVLERTDVLIWWGHMAHDAVRDDIVDRVYRRVLDGMGLIALHSAHYSKIFRKLMGTTCSLRWRDDGEHERLWVVNPRHPIVNGLPLWIDLPQEEMYGEFFDIPHPEEIIFLSWFPGGEVFRSGVTFTRGRGRIFYFRPGHETFGTYFHPLVQKVLVNAVAWAAPTSGPTPVFGRAEPLEPSAS